MVCLGNMCTDTLHKGDNDDDDNDNNNNNNQIILIAIEKKTGLKAKVIQMNQLDATMIY